MKKAAWLWISWLLLLPLTAEAGLSSIAFYYGNHPPLASLHAYDAAVLDPASAIQPKNIRLNGTTLLAYVSLGETSQSASYFKALKASWTLGSNPTWHSAIMNAADPQWQAFFITHVIQPLWEQGYRGFFLDTIDAYMRVSHTQEEKAKQVQGLNHLIHAIHEKYPNATLILNRGFQCLPAVAPDIQAVAAESLYSGWNEAAQRYEPVSKANFDYLYTELLKVKALGLPVIVIDYTNPKHTEEAKHIAKKIAALGFIPYVADGRLQTMGLGAVQPIPRRIFVIYTMPNAKTTVFNPEAFTLLALPIETLGYIPEYHNATEPLPPSIYTNDYAGIVVLAAQLTLAQQNALKTFLIQSKNNGVKIAFIANFGFDATNDNLQPYGITIQTNLRNGIPHLQITKQDKSLVGYEVQPIVNQYDYDLYDAHNAQVALELTSAYGSHEDAIAITPWGGYALDPYIAINTPNDDSMWVINPFTFISKALRLPALPIPDVTTENGQRLAFIHIDGDGFANPSQSGNGKIAAVELEEKILKPYALPTTFSVVTADLQPNGLYPEQAPFFQSVAKNIFSLPYVQAASHTFSHPFDWVKIKTATKNGLYNLPVKNYHFNDFDEIHQSAETINQLISSAHKKTVVLLWSGYANVDEKELIMADEAQLLSMNGGSTNINRKLPFLSLVSPAGQVIGDHYQVFAPIGNEEYYTNGWSQPLYGFRRVIETFELTNAPVRLKPVDIYYHIYSASTEASLQALQTVYEWAKSQPLAWIYASDYINKAHDAINTSIALQNHQWVIKTNGEVREFHYPSELGYPDLSKSQNVVGFNQVNHQIYVHSGISNDTVLVLTNHAPTKAHLVESNARLTQFTHTETGFNFHLIGNSNITFTLFQPEGCTLTQAAQWESPVLNGKSIGNHQWNYSLASKDSHELKLSCRS